MLDFKKELGNVIKKGYDERVQEECLKAVLSAFEELKEIKPLIFHFYLNAFPKLCIIKEEKADLLSGRKNLKIMMR